MRKLLGSVLIVVVIIAALGFYRGWFSVSTDDQPGQTNVELTIDKEKIKQDTEEASQKAKELGADIERRMEAGSGNEP